MKHEVLCRYCKKAFDTNKEEYEMPKPRFYYHKKCYIDFQQESMRIKPPHLVTCRYCKKKFDTNKEPYEMPDERWYYHSKCYEKYLLSMSPEERQKTLEAKALYKYVKSLFGDKLNFQLYEKQVRKYTDEGYTLSGIYHTVKWFFEIQGNSVDKARGGIGVVPYVYERASVYWNQIWSAQKANLDKDNLKDFLPTERAIVIAPPTVESKPIKLFFEGDDD